MRFAIVDIETTGTRLSQDRILEVGVVIVENNHIERVFTTLVNPKQYIPSMISELTGITAADVKDAPIFQEIAQELHTLLRGCIFVAHNAAFDYGFIHAEFERLGMDFRAKMLCTVRLSRKLFPHYRRHSLSAIIERFQISTEARHRALADAQAVWEFMQILPQHFAAGHIEKALEEIINTQRIPPQLTAKLIKDLPHSPGVYIFYDQNDSPLYIGKSINIHERVKQHLQSSTQSNKELHIFSNLARIETIETAGELSALLLESTLIKQKFPLLNRQLRKTKKVFVLWASENQDGYMIIQGDYCEHMSVEKLAHVMGVFTSQKQAISYLEFVCQRHQLCQKLIGLQKTNNACFNYHLKKCKGACLNLEQKEEYNARFLDAFTATRIAQWPFPGPITIEEKSENGELSEKITIDRWCIVGHEKDGLPTELETDASIFNLDDYKIISAHLKKHFPSP